MGYTPIFGPTAPGCRTTRSFRSTRRRFLLLVFELGRKTSLPLLRHMRYTVPYAAPLRWWRHAVLSFLDYTVWLLQCLSQAAWTRAPSFSIITSATIVASATVSRFAHIVKAEMLPKNAAWIRDNVDEAPRGPTAGGARRAGRNKT
jgi:hypothetical protein